MNDPNPDNPDLIGNVQIVKFTPPIISGLGY